jgi:hypothetical protein
MTKKKHEKSQKGKKKKRTIRARQSLKNASANAADIPTNSAFFLPQKSIKIKS